MIQHSSEMTDVYYTIQKEGRGLFKEKMSKFLSFAIPVSSADEARAVVKNIQNEYHDARHVCWAYMLGPSRLEWQLNDNGEPSGTAGKPILGQINSFEVTDLVVAVVRYFGGIKLGTSGLIAAYREAARLAIEDAGIKEMHEMCDLSVTFPYMSLNSVMRIVKSGGVEIVTQQFDNTCSLELSIRKENYGSFKKRLLDVDGVTEA